MNAVVKTTATLFERIVELQAREKSLTDEKHELSARVVPSHPDLAAVKAKIIETRTQIQALEREQFALGVTERWAQVEGYCFEREQLVRQALPLLIDAAKLLGQAALLGKTALFIAPEKLPHAVAAIESGAGLFEASKKQFDAILRGSPTAAAFLVNHIERETIEITWPITNTTPPAAA